MKMWRGFFSFARCALKGIKMKKILLAATLLIFLPCGVRAETGDAAQALSPPGAIMPQGETPDWGQYKDPYAGEVANLANANRTGEEITAWGSKAVAEALSFTPNDFEKQIRESQKYFMQTGWADYAEYLKNTQLLGIAQSGKYAIAAIPNGEPMITDSGAQNGAWHWTLNVPVIISVSTPDPSGALQTVSTRKTRLTLVLSRVAEGGDDGIAVAGWKAVE
jgi:hypothetical protein